MPLSECWSGLYFLLNFASFAVIHLAVVSAGWVSSSTEQFVTVTPFFAHFAGTSTQSSILASPAPCLLADMRIEGGDRYVSYFLAPPIYVVFWGWPDSQIIGLESGTWNTSPGLLFPQRNGWLWRSVQINLLFCTAPVPPCTCFTNFVSSHTTKFCLPSLVNAGLLYPIGFHSINHHSSHHILMLRPECAQVDTKALQKVNVCKHPPIGRMEILSMAGLCL